jgi:hypothetical protein
VPAAREAVIGVDHIGLVGPAVLFGRRPQRRAGRAQAIAPGVVQVENPDHSAILVEGPVVVRHHIAIAQDAQPGLGLEVANGPPVEIVVGVGPQLCRRGRGLPHGQIGFRKVGRELQHMVEFVGHIDGQQPPGEPAVHGDIGVAAHAAVAIGLVVVGAQRVGAAIGAVIRQVDVEDAVVIGHGRVKAQGVHLHGPGVFGGFEHQLAVAGVRRLLPVAADRRALRVDGSGAGRAGAVGEVRHQEHGGGVADHGASGGRIETAA